MKLEMKELSGTRSNLSHAPVGVGWARNRTQQAVAPQRSPLRRAAGSAVPYLVLLLNAPTRP